MNFVLVTMFPRNGNWILLRNFALGSVACIDCFYVVGKCDSPRQAKKVVTAINQTLRRTGDDDFFSTFRAEVSKGVFPVKAKAVGAPLRVATPMAVQEWIEQYLPQPIDASDFDQEAQCMNFSFMRKYSGYNPALDGEPCSVQ